MSYLYSNRDGTYSVPPTRQFGMSFRRVFNSHLWKCSLCFRIVKESNRDLHFKHHEGTGVSDGSLSKEATLS